MTGLPPVTRRFFLGAVGATAGVLAISGPASAIAPRPGVGDVPLTYTLRRRNDLTLLRVTFLGMVREGDRLVISPTTPYLNPVPFGAQVGRMIIDIGPQAVLEEANYYPPNGAPAPPVRSRLAGSSRIVVNVTSAVDLTLTSMLAWAQWLTATAGPAVYPRGANIPANVLEKGYTPPAPDETSIEMPWWLIVSPNIFTTWSQRVQPKTVAGRSEVFSTWFGQFDREGQPDRDGAAATIRGLWIRDPGAQVALRDGMVNPRMGSEGYPFEILPKPADRADFVRLTTRTGANVPGGVANPVDAAMTLTTLGGHLSTFGAWDEPGVSSVASWQQRIWQGRDTYVKIVRRGFLYPWGIRAYQVTEGVRIWSASNRAAGDIRPYWFTRTQVGVTDPTLVYADVDATTVAGRRGATFRSVTCTTTVTPFLAQPTAGPETDGWAGKAVYVPKVPRGNSSTPFAFDFIGVDANGQQVAFSMPLLFAEEAPANFTEAGARTLRAYYAARPDSERRADFSGRYVGFATAAGDPLDTAMPVTTMFFAMSETFDGDVRLISSDSNLLEFDGQPRNMPLLQTANVIVEDLSRITGQQVNAVLDYPRAYVSAGLDRARNAGLVYLKKATEEVTRIGMDAAKAGGVMVPTMDLAGFSAGVGPVYGTAESLAELAADGTITPADALSAITLLGGVSLADVLPSSFPALDGGLPSTKALRTTTRLVDEGLPTERVVTTMAMSWAASELVPSGVAELLLNVDDASLSIQLVSEVPTAGGDAAWSVLGNFTDFTVSLVPVEGLAFVAVDVARLAFSAGSKTSTDVDIDVTDVRFGGALAFIADLAAYLPFGDGLSIEVGGRGISAGLSVGLPAIALGAFTLSGIAVRTGFTLPFGSDPVRFRFGMSAPDDPFGMTVLGLGGGGWFTQDLGLDGIEYFEAAAFVQAKVALDLGVASGSVSVQLGMQFALGAPEAGDDERCTLTAFVRIQGRVDVLGIVTVGIEVYIGLGIDLPLPIPDDPDDLLQITAHGEAECSVRIKLAFWSKRVRFTVRRSFKGSDLPGSSFVVGVLSSRAGEPPVTPITFADAVTREDWAEFCGAFA
ncbi:MAG: hypothetical protein ACOYNJ_09105 [Candidatus Nanopelagicales bacterium]|jgi:hypothetical protein